MTFTQQCAQDVATLYAAIIDHPFNQELQAGTLAAARFGYYVQQDSLYLADYARALALLAAKAPSSAVAEDLLNYARDGIAVERALHGHFLDRFNLQPATEQLPACMAYTSFLLARTALDAYAVGLAAVLPCFSIYRDVGHHIAAHVRPDNPYQPWIDTYSDAAFDTAVRRMLDLTDEAAANADTATVSAMSAAFLHSTRCEWSFWDAAYQQTQWPS